MNWLGASLTGSMQRPDRPKRHSITSRYVHTADAMLLAAVDAVANKTVKLMAQSDLNRGRIKRNLSCSQIDAETDYPRGTKTPIKK
jgi:hypothetical protein